MNTLVFMQGDEWKDTLSLPDNLLTAFGVMDSISHMLKDGYWLELDGTAKIDNSGQRYLRTMNGWEPVEFETFMEYAANEE